MNSFNEIELVNTNTIIIESHYNTNEESENEDEDDKKNVILLFELLLHWKIIFYF